MNNLPVWAKWVLIAVGVWIGLSILVGCIAMAGVSQHQRQPGKRQPGMGGCYDQNWKPVPC